MWRAVVTGPLMRITNTHPKALSSRMSIGLVIEQFRGSICSKSITCSALLTDELKIPIIDDKDAPVFSSREWHRFLLKKGSYLHFCVRLYCSEIIRRICEWSIWFSDEHLILNNWLEDCSIPCEVTQHLRAFETRHDVRTIDEAGLWFTTLVSPWWCPRLEQARALSLPLQVEQQPVCPPLLDKG